MEGRGSTENTNPLLVRCYSKYQKQEYTISQQHPGTYLDRLDDPLQALPGMGSLVHRRACWE